MQASALIEMDRGYFEEYFGQWLAQRRNPNCAYAPAAQLTRRFDPVRGHVSLASGLPGQVCKMQNLVLKPICK
jgi:hypothetical protein